MTERKVRLDVPEGSSALNTVVGAIYDVLEQDTDGAVDETTVELGSVYVDAGDVTASIAATLDLPVRTTDARHIRHDDVDHSAIDHILVGAENTVERAFQDVVDKPRLAVVGIRRSGQSDHWQFECRVLDEGGEDGA